MTDKDDSEANPGRYLTFMYFAVPAVVMLTYIFVSFETGVMVGFVAIITLLFIIASQL